MTALIDTPRRLLVAIHDVSPRFETEVARLRDLLVPTLAANRCALLVVPDHWGSAPIVPGSAFARRLRGWAEQGAEVFLHGWVHRDTARHVTRLDRWKARHLTAGEGEFLGLSREEATARMRAGRRLLEDVTGLPVRGFVAPAWLYGPGALAAMTDAGFELAEDHMRVWNPSTGARLCSGPVLTWASRSPARIASSLAAAAVLPALQRRQATARIGVHPGDIGEPILVRSIVRALDRLLTTHAPARYASLLAHQDAACVSS